MNPVTNALFRLFRANETHVHELNYLFWECTTRCNLHCRHCGSDCKDCGGEKDMPAEDFLRAFDTIPTQNRQLPFTVVITGGEPLLRDDLPAIGKAIRQRGVGWGLVSNGWLYDEAMHHRLMAAGMGSLTISLDGLQEDHDWMRGREGSYVRALNAIAIAAKQPRLNFDVVTCVNQRNLPHLQAIHDQLAQMGVGQWRIFTIIPIGRALNNPELHLNDLDYNELRQKNQGTGTLLIHSSPDMPFAPTSTVHVSPKAISTPTTSGMSGRPVSSHSATGNGHAKASATTAKPSICASATVCTTGTATAPHPSTATIIN